MVISSDKLSRKEKYYIELTPFIILLLISYFTIYLVNKKKN